MIEEAKTLILPNCQVPNGFFGVTVNFIIQKLSASFPQFSLVTVFFEGMRENILHTFWALKIALQLLPQAA